MNSKSRPHWGWLVFGFFGILLIAFIGMYVSSSNRGARFESGIQASHDNSRNILGQYAPKIRDALGVSKAQTKAVEDIITGANTSRYGGSGSQATVQWITEQNPNLDQGSYKRIIDMIEAGRNDFQTAQTVKIDKIKEYNIALKEIPSKWFLSMAGYPSANYVTAGYDKIVTSGHAADAFETGRDDGLDLNSF